MLMCDWLTFVLDFPHPFIRCGRTLKIDQNDELLGDFPQRRRFEGSHESSIAVASNNVNEERTIATKLFVDGNPSKFLQGHNIVGSDDICLLALGVVTRIAKSLNFEVDAITRKRILAGEFVVKRIDINGFYEFESQTEAEAFLDAMAKKSRTRSGRGSMDKGTVYFNKRSKLWAVKFYSKYNEITKGGKGHKLHYEFMRTPLVDWSHKKIRGEVVLKHELKKIAQKTDNHAEDILAKQLTPDVLQELFNEYMGRIQMSSQMLATANAEELLPRAARNIYIAWTTGRDVKNNVGKSQYYQHKKTIKQVLDIDISLPPIDTQDVSYNVIPLRRVIETKQAAYKPEFNDLKLIYSGE